MQPQTQYTRAAGDVNIGYQVVGEGPLDLVFVPGIICHLDLWWEDPNTSRFFRRLASFARLILFDKRGLGVSDRLSSAVTIEERMDDIRAVMDAAGSERAAILGVSEGVPLALVFAASHPDRCRSLGLVGGCPRMCRADDYPIGISAEQMIEGFDEYARDWGKPAMMRLLAPSHWQDPRTHEWFGRFERSAASPGAMLNAIKMNVEIDVRHVLPQIRMPTLVVHRAEDISIPVESGRYLAEHIPDAKYAELPGRDHAFWVDPDPLLDEIQEFFTGVRTAPEVDRVLGTVLFTDIVESTQLASELGDRRWTELLERHGSVMRRHVQRFRGEVLDDLGDGMLAFFDGPARAIRAGCAIRDELKGLGLEIRAGLHTGECERTGDKVSGIAVHIGARVAAKAGAGEVLVSSTVRDLVAGSGIPFEDRGLHTLKGVPDEWRLLAVQAA